MGDFNIDSEYIVFSSHVRKNVKTGQDELEIMMYDLKAEDEDHNVVTITAKDFDTQNRSAQSFEEDRAKTILKSGFELID